MCNITFSTTGTKLGTNCTSDWYITSTAKLNITFATAGTMRPKLGTNCTLFSFPWFP